MPVGVVAGQPRHLQAQHDPGPAHADLGDQVLESFPVGGRGAGLALVGVDGDDRLGCPAQRDRLLPQGVLAGGGFGVGQHLPQCGLAHIQVGGAGQVRTGHLRRGLLAHRRSPLRRNGERHRREQPDQLGVHPATGGPGRAGGRRRVGRGGRLADPQPCRNTALLQHGQSQPPPVDVAAECPAAQLLIPVHHLGSTTVIIVDVIARLHFWNF